MPATPGTAEQCNVQLAGLGLVTSNARIGMEVVLPSSMQYINTAQASSFESIYIRFYAVLVACRRETPLLTTHLTR